MSDFHIVMNFGKGISGEMQAKIMFDLEKKLREQGIPVEIFKETMKDDSKLRRNMTPLERARL